MMEATAHENSNSETIVLCRLNSRDTFGFIVQRLPNTVQKLSFIALYMMSQVVM